MTMRGKPGGHGLRGAFAILAIALPLLGSAQACAPARNRSTGTEAASKKLSLAQLYLEAEKYSEAVDLLSELARQQPRNPDIQYNLGIAHFGVRDYAAAEKALKESLRLDPRRSDVHYYLGAVYYATGNRGGALGEYRKALAEPSSTSPEQTHLSIAILQDEMGNIEEAIASARLAIEKNPKYYPAHYELAVLLDRQERTREAIEEYEIAAPDYASDSNYHYRLGVAYFRDNKPAQAREHLSKVTAGAPGTEKAHKAKEFLDLIAAGAPAPNGANTGSP